MLNISNANKAKWNASTGFKTVIIEFPDDDITISNSDIVRESLELEEAIENGYNLAFTGCIASRLSFNIADIIQDLRGHLVTARIRVDSETAIPLFYGYIDSQDNLSHEDVITKFKAYDPLVSKINEVDVTDWYNGLTFPLSVKAFRDAFFLALDIPQKEALLINDSLIISSKTITSETITGGQIIKYICQLNAVFGQFDRKGYFRYIALAPMTEGLYPAVDLYPAQDLYPSRENASIDGSSFYNKIKYEPFVVDSIEKVKIIASDGTVGGAYGDGPNTFTIHDNPLAWAVNMAEAAENIFVNITDLAFTPAEIGLVGLPYIECGDTIFINTMKNIVRSYVLSRSLFGIQSIMDAFSCPSDKVQPVYKETQKTEISRNNDEIKENSEAIVETHDYVDTSVEAEAARADALIASSIYAEEIRTNTLVASRIQAEEIRADRAILSAIQAEEIRADRAILTAVQAEEIRADRAIVSAIDAEAIRTNNLIAQKIEAEEIRANTFTTQKVNAEETRTNTLVANSIQAEAIRTNNLVSSEIGSEVIRTNNLLAEKASLNYVNGNFATFQYLNANYLSAQSIQSSYATIGQLNALSGRVGTLEANSITTQYLYANDITVKSLYAWGGNVQGSALIGSVVNCDSISMGGYTATWQSKTINGVTINYLGR